MNKLNEILLTCSIRKLFKLKIFDPDKEFEFSYSWMIVPNQITVPVRIGTVVRDFGTILFGSVRGTKLFGSVRGS